MSYRCNVCEYCNSYHDDKKCPLEQLLAPYMREIVGHYMEEFVADEIYCPRCNIKSLEPLRNHAPSLDIVCTNCKTKFEMSSLVCWVTSYPSYGFNEIITLPYFGGSLSSPPHTDIDSTKG